MRQKLLLIMLSAFIGSSFIVPLKAIADANMTGGTQPILTRSERYSAMKNTMRQSSYLTRD